jgi:hypothetical protein
MFFHERFRPSEVIFGLGVMLLLGGCLMREVALNHQQREKTTAGGSVANPTRPVGGPSLDAAWGRAANMWCAELMVTVFSPARE